MISINDSAYNSLREMGYTGSINDMLYHYWLSNGMSFTSRYAYLRSLGYIGSINDMEYDFWRDGGGDEEREILALFSNGEQGAWCDPSDLSSMFQDSVGTIPAAVDQPVGLMLDKRLGLVRGPELVVNGGFDSDVSGWSVFNSGNVAVTWEAPGEVRSTGGQGGIYQNVPVTPGQAVALVVRLRVDAVSLLVGVYESGFSTTLATKLQAVSGDYTEIQLIATPTQPSVRIYLRGTVDHDARIGSISVRELPGNHASQETTTARPVLRQDDRGFYRLDTDGVDDFMTALSVPTLEQPTTYAAAIQSDQLSRASIFDSSTTGTSGRHVLGISSNTDYRVYASSTSVEAPIGQHDKPHVLLGVIDGPNTSLQVDSGPLIIGSTGATPLSSGLRLFSRGASGGSDIFTGGFYGGIVLNRAITATERLQIQQWLATKAGVTL